MSKKYDLILIDSFTENAYEDSHGFCTLNIIQENHLYNVKKIDIGLKHDLTTSSNKILLKSLSKIKYGEANVISIPLASKCLNHKVYEYLKQLSHRGVKIIAPYMNSFNGKSFPASLPFVRGVKGASFGSNEITRKVDNIYYYNDTPSVFFKNNNFSYFYGNSKACAVATRHLIEQNNREPTSTYCERTHISLNSLLLTIYKIEDIIKKNIDLTIPNIFDLPLYNSHIGVTKKDIPILIKKVILPYLNQTKTFINLDDISTIRKITKLIGDKNE